MVIEIAAGAAMLTGAVLVLRRLTARRAARARASERRRSSESEGKLAVGDVLLIMDRELWLAGEVLLIDGPPVLRLFLAPGDPDAWLAVMDGEEKDRVLLEPTDVPPGRMPDSFRVSGHALSLRRRGRAKVTCEGEGLPPFGSAAEYAILRGSSGRTLVVVDFQDGTRLALAGERLEPCLVGHLPSPERTA